MRILYYSPRPCWPANTGARIRDYYLAKGLAQSAELTYAAMAEPGATFTSLPEDAGFRQVAIPKETSYSPAKIAGGWVGPLPVTIRNYSSHSGKQELTRLLRKGNYDTVQIEGVHLYDYVSAIRAAVPGVKILADWHNIESELMQRYADGAAGWPKRLYARRTAELIARCEDRLLGACDMHTVVSEREREKLKRRRPDAAIRVVPNGVDVSYFGQVKGAGRDLVFVGSMDYHANADAACWFVREVWPQLKSLPWNGRLLIVGRAPGSEVRALAGERLEVTGTVDDVRPYYANALALIVPLRVGGGTRLKLLEALAAGVPVISTSLGAEGIPVRNGETVLLANEPAEMVHAVERLLLESGLRERLVEAGRKFVVESFDWASVARTMLAAHLEMK